MARFTVNVNYSFKEDGEDELTLRARSADDITEDDVRDALVKLHPRLSDTGSDLEIDSWAVDE